MSMNSTELLQAEITDLRRQRDDALRARDENAAELKALRARYDEQAAQIDVLQSCLNADLDAFTRANTVAEEYLLRYVRARKAWNRQRQAHRELVEAARAAVLSEAEAAEQDARRDDAFWTRLEMNPFGCPEREPEYDPDAA